MNANTTYGAPNTTLYGTSTGVTYTFTSSQRICYLQPQGMQVYGGTTLATAAASKFPYQNASNQGGYNPATWQIGSISAYSYTQTGGGFKVASGFPTTGFEKAAFSVIGSGSDQSKYRCSTTSPATKINLSGTAGTELGANCTVTYNAATKAAFIAGGTPTIIMEYNRGTAATPNWVIIDSYTIPTPSKWAILKGELTYGNTNSLATSTQFPALDACRGVTLGTTTWQQAAGQNPADKAFRQQFLFRRDELTSSPESLTAEGSSPVVGNGLFSRDVDGTFTGEWGLLIYSGSGWTTSNGTWTAEAWSTAQMFRAAGSGTVMRNAPNLAFVLVACRD